MLRGRPLCLAGMILEPELAIIDAHHHLFDTTPLLPGAPGYLLPDFLQDVAMGHRIEASVLVEVAAFYRASGPTEFRPVGEVETVSNIAANCAGRRGTRVAAGIVGFADLRLGANVRPVLEALLTAGGGRLHGVRYITASDPDPAINRAGRPAGLMADSDFRAGFAQLAPLGLSFDAWLHQPQLPELIALAQRFPDTTIVVDHLGGPLRIGAYSSRRDEAYADWRAAIVRLAKLPNVVMKLGGLGMRFFGWPVPVAATSAESGAVAGFLAQQWRPWVEPCIEAFGVRRCLFESNFPVDKVHCNYADLWNAYKTITKGCSPSDKADLYRNTAARVYRLAAASS